MTSADNGVQLTAARTEASPLLPVTAASRGPEDTRGACQHHMRFVAAVLLGACALAAGCLAAGLPPALASSGRRDAPLLPPPPSASALGAFRHAAVSADTAACPAVGRDVLARNGSAVDAAVATLLCQGVAAPHLSGLGGGFFMVAYSPRGGAVALDARETASRDAAADDVTPRGGKSVAVPGMARGLWEAHQKFGKLPWAALVQPSIRLSEHGVPVSATLAQHLRAHRDLVEADPVLREVFTDAASGALLREGDVLRNRRMAATLRAVAREGGEALHSGPLAAALSRDICRAGGAVTARDLAGYRPAWRGVVTARLQLPRLGPLELHTSPAPSSGPVLAHVLNVLEAFNMTAADERGARGRVVFLHRLVEAFKHAFSKRPWLGDPGFVDMDEVMALLLSKAHARSVRRRISDFRTEDEASSYGPLVAQPEDSGTTHVSVLGPGGDAVAITASLNHRFGAGFMSNATGLLLNSHMDDFSRPGAPGDAATPSYNNFVEPGKRPLSSMTPSIFTEPGGRVRLVVGASGGPRIVTSVALVCARHLWLDDDLKQAIDARRVHHQFIPNTLQHEHGLTRQVLQGLRHRGHRTLEARGTFSVVCAVGRAQDGSVFANSDFRHGGAVEGLD
ncbi:glutathione hydrolase 1 proenzyme-like [Bacillus rossius redtenbacheri]|uniref:glutathione hydrolase 1 proenzyme-like n=1 Tax=Bacillus rossius redtenbacheri TaxID=93214 RepID=UPI002FDD3587